jgi:NitT/TauT family transport system ATP-binding protein
MSPSLELPDYREQSPEVADRFRRIYERPVVLEVRDLHKRFQSPDGGEVEALRGVSFDVHRREFVCVIGPSGCGKSTLVRMLAGLDFPTSGHILVDGTEPHGPGADRGMVFQGYTLFHWLTVRRNVMFGLEAKEIGRDKAEADARFWIDMVGLGKFIDAYPHQLSGGMKQRVAIARALATQPRVLLMDEPFGALDAQTRCSMQSYLHQIWRNVNVTVVFITHDLDEAVYLADRIVVLAAHPGRIQEVIEVPLPHPRTPEQLADPRFIATRLRLDELIHPKTTHSAERLPVTRMTLVGDDVF